jgi:ribonuclease T2
LIPWRRLIAAALLVAAGPAFAEGRETRGGPSGRFDFYVLALSWSPGFCEIRGDGADRTQCAPGKGLRFVVHGLWPQNDAGYPVFCEPGGRFATRAATDSVGGLFPSTGLARYQWRKHGTCSGESPTGYFGLVKQALQRVILPEQMTKANATTTAMPLEIERAFAAANPGLRPEMMSVQCRRGILSEIRICLSRDLREFRECREIDQGGCRAGQISIPAAR